MRTGKFEIGPDQRRAAQCGEDAALLWWFASHGPVNSRSKPRGIGVVFSKPLRQGSDQFAICIQAENLEPRHAALDQPVPIIPERSLLCRIPHWPTPKLVSYIQKYIQNFHPRQVI